MRLRAVYLIAVIVGSCAAPHEGPAVQTTFVADGWQANEVLVPAVKGIFSDSDRKAFRRGTTPHGLPYEYNEHRAVVGEPYAMPAAGWSGSCKTDAMTDERSCTISNISMMLFFNSSVSVLNTACIIGHSYPGRTAFIRIDQNQPSQVVNKSCRPAGDAFLSELLSGNDALVRYYKWPNDWSRDDKFALKGLREAIDLLKFTQKAR